MKLSDLALAAKAKVPAPGVDEKGKPNFFDVRGLSLVDILGLVDRHRGPLSEAFGNLAGDNDEALKNFGAMSKGFLGALPDVAADVIAVAMDEPEAVDAAKGLVASYQLAILEKVAELTFAAEGGAGKVIEIVLSAVGGATSVVKNLGQPT